MVWCRKRQAHSVFVVTVLMEHWNFCKYSEYLSGSGKNSYSDHLVSHQSVVSLSRVKIFLNIIRNSVNFDGFEWEGTDPQI